MKVVLTKDIPKLGQQGTIVSVSDGHARNFLIPRGLARPADKGAINQAKSKQESIKRKEEKREEGVRKNQKELADTTLLIAKKANDKGHLFAAVSTAEIIKELKAKRFTFIKDKDIEGAPLKEVGEHTLLINVSGKKIPVTVKIENL